MGHGGAQAVTPHHDAVSTYHHQHYRLALEGRANFTERAAFLTEIHTAIERMSIYTGDREWTYEHRQNKGKPQLPIHIIQSNGTDILL